MSMLSTSQKILSNILLSRLSPYIGEITGNHNAGFNIIDQLPTRLSLVRREVIYNILIEPGVLMKLVRLIKMCLNETYGKVCIGKNLSDTFPIQNI
jgi:hypothetical protein